MVDKPARFQARSRIIRDEIIPAEAVRLYMLMDDIGWTGECVVKQAVLADGISVTTRTVRNLAAILERSGYLVIDRQKLRVRYVLGWHADRKPVSDLIGHECGKQLPPDRKPVSDLSLLEEKKKKEGANLPFEIQNENPGRAVPAFECSACYDTGKARSGPDRGSECLRCGTARRKRREAQEAWKRTA